MKNKYIIRLAVYMIIIPMLTGLNACKKSLDKSLDIAARDRLTDASVWTDQGTADVFLNDIYGVLPDGNNWYDPFDNWSDNSICGFGWPLSRTQAQQANYTPSTLAFWTGLPYDWGTNYNYIRKTNIFIAKVGASSLSADFKKSRLAEARFLRAYFYQLLWMSYGGVPVITQPLNVTQQGDSIFKARNTFEETTTFITGELAAVAADLPEANEPGRITKGAALALKGWCELFAKQYAASAATNKDIIDNLGNGKVYDLFPDYGGLFMPENNGSKEGIFYRQYIPRVKGGRNEGYNGPTFTKGGTETSWGGVNPTQELVDDYAMDNGLTISDPASGYNAQTPYIHRESRFYQTIVYDGSYFYNDTIYTRQGTGSKNEIDLSDKDWVQITGMAEAADKTIIIFAMQKYY